MKPAKHAKLTHSLPHCSDGVLSDRSGELVVKPCDRAEITFYESTIHHPDLKYFTPKFYGTLSLGTPDDIQPAPTAETSEPNPNDESVLKSRGGWVPSGGGKIKTDCAIVLENVAAGFQNPNILDVKLGARLWDDDAPPAKRLKLDNVAAETTSKPLGFRLAGAKKWMGAEVAENEELGLKGYRKYDKNWGRVFTTENVKDGFADFFYVKGSGMSKALARRVVRRFAADLRDLQATLEKEESRMYSASILFVYEGNPEALSVAFAAEKEWKDKARTRHESAQLMASMHRSAGKGGGNASSETEPGSDGEKEEEEEEEPALPKIQAVKLIDFAHAHWTPGQGADENMLHGVRNVVRILEDLSEEFRE